MDFVAVVLVLVLYFVRPQDWVPGMAGFGVVKPVMAFAFVSMYLAAQKAGTRIRLLATPHDWIMLAYFAYIVMWSPAPMETFKGFLPLYAFYVVTVQALNTWGRTRIYLKWWMWGLLFVVATAVLSLYGLDITNAQPNTDYNKGRLSGGSWIHKNPNALGHSAYLLIPLSWMLLFRKGTAVKRLLCFGIIILTFHCIFETESRGAYLGCLATILAAVLFGQSRLIQVIGLVAALAAGGAVLSLMPRFQESSLQGEGIIGRLMAWEVARTSIKTHFTGEGWKEFGAMIKWEKETLFKATHSSYVQLGADLGYPGLFLYAALLWCGFRSLLRKPPDLPEDGLVSRTCMFAIFVGTALSGWMIDRAYHTEFFLLMAMLASVERLQSMSGGEERERILAWKDWNETPVWLRSQDPPVSLPKGSDPDNLDTTPALKIWTKPSPIDVVMAGTVLWSILYFWDFQISRLP